jgi:hypothetical protein
MKPFDLKAALAGAKVINGQGKPATDIAYFPSVISHYKVYAVIDEGVLAFTETGYFCENRHLGTRADLFMAPVTNEGWINIYKGRKLGKFVHKTEEEARAIADLGLIDCVRIEWENKGD